MKLALITFFLFSSLQAFAHGDNTPGPHGGFVRMPGAFHTELTADSDTAFKIYLLDIEFKNPTLKDSKLDIKISAQGKSGKITCRPGTEFFQCDLPAGFTLQSGKLAVKAIRERAVGNVVRYNLPLHFTPPKAPAKDPHAGH